MKRLPTLLALVMVLSIVIALAWWMGGARRNLQYQEALDLQRQVSDQAALSAATARHELIEERRRSDARVAAARAEAVRETDGLDVDGVVAGLRRELDFARSGDDGGNLAIP